MSAALPELLDRVAGYTAEMDVEGEDWQSAVAAHGLLVTGRESAAARHILERAVETQTDEGLLAYGWGDYPKEWARWTDYDVESYKPTANPAAMAYPVLELYDRTGEDHLLDAVRRQYEFFETVERTADGGITRRADKVELFSEIIYFLSPFFVRYGQIVGDDEAIADAVKQIEVHAKHLQDPHTGLFRHIWQEQPNTYPGGSFWSRGNGWAAAGLLDTLLLLPDDHPDRDVVADSLYALLDAVADLQDGSGFWHQRLDDPMSPLETSGTLIFAYTMQRGLNEGLLDERYADNARRAMEACEGIVDDDGAVKRVSKPPASSFSPLGVTPYGQGWFLLAGQQFV
ncbi:glycoside hydrolase family 88 protein [Salinirarus marinus]|uniref:glycoside hydrolase family 88 protein n=1 Tax=Salinirarus marinus TaxID=3068310 RepID=UPI003C6BE8AF